MKNDETDAHRIWESYHTIISLPEIKKCKEACQDPVCHRVGCLNQPAWRFRELIKDALHEGESTNGNSSNEEGL